MPLLTPNRELPLALLLTSLAALLLLLITFDVAPLYQAGFSLLFGLCSLLLLLLTASRLINSLTERRRLPVGLLGVLLGLAALMGLSYAWRSGAFYGRKVLSGVFLDDFSRLDLTLYEDGRYLLESGWLLGPERFTGRYTMRGDSIGFHQPVLATELKNLVLVRRGSRLYFHRPGAASDTSFYHFQIQAP